MTFMATKLYGNQENYFISSLILNIFIIGKLTEQGMKVDSVLCDYDGTLVNSVPKNGDITKQILSAIVPRSNY